MKTHALRQRAENLGEDILKEIDSLEEVSDLINLKHIMTTVLEDVKRKVARASTGKAEGIAAKELLKK